jgi:lipopolysaccharide transport system ATP-binding protein
MDMNSDIAIRIDNLGKCYQLGNTVDYGRMARNLFHRFHKRSANTNAAGPSLNNGIDPDDPRIEVESQKLWALRNVDLEVKQGEVIGVIGNNGAGKSTLLKVLTRITYPTEGTAELRGRVGALLEVGTGFNPEMTGRENVFLNGAILGMGKKEILSKFDEIVDFSGCEKMIDTPVKRYSSGMRVRLAFAVAAHLDPEILIVDEVLSVGDLRFQEKCLNRLDNAMSEGKTVFFVSHNMNAINRLCSRTVLMEYGRVLMDGPTVQVVQEYMRINSPVNQSAQTFQDNPHLPQQVMEATICRPDGTPIDTPINATESFVVQVRYRIDEPMPTAYGVAFLSNQNNDVVMLSDSRDCCSESQFATTGVITASIPFEAPLLVPGKYQVSVSIGAEGRGALDEKRHCLQFEIVDLSGVRAARPGFLYRPIPWQMRNA